MHVSASVGQDLAKRAACAFVFSAKPSMTATADSAAASTALPPPDGYLPLFRTSPFLVLNGPFFYKPNSPSGDLSQGFSIGFRVGPQHLNAKGIMHGGLYATVADVALGYVTAAARPAGDKLLTTNLSLDYVADAREGDWLDVEVSILKNGRRLAVANALIRCCDRVLASARASFLPLVPAA